ncbi:MAG: PadR family transcriptional regulator [bacterium]|nr:PadR family transcriptional regulator [bacterium]
MKLLSRAEELVLLAIWRLQDNAYCVPIREQVQIVTGKEWTFGAVYIPLHRLEKKGFVDSILGNATTERGGRSKRYYKVRKKGLKALSEIKKVENAMWDGIPEFSVE